MKLFVILVSVRVHDKKARMHDLSLGREEFEHGNCGIARALTKSQ